MHELPFVSVLPSSLSARDKPPTERALGLDHTILELPRWASWPADFPCVPKPRVQHRLDSPGAPTISKSQ